MPRSSFRLAGLGLPVPAKFFVATKMQARGLLDNVVPVATNPDAPLGSPYTSKE